MHGLNGSGPGHWQTWLADALRGHRLPVSYPELPDPDAPSLDSWCEALEADLGRAASPVVICHSLGAVTWLHLVARLRRPLAARVLLVAPPSAASGIPEIADFVPPPLDPVAVALAATATRLVCAPTGDFFCPEGAGVAYGQPLGLPVDEIAGGGHLNTDAGYGPWPAVERWCLDETAVPIGPRPISA